MLNSGHLHRPSKLFLCALIIIAVILSPADVPTAQAQVDPPLVITRVDTNPVYRCSADPLDGVIRGSGFVDGLTVKLVMAGQADMDVPVIVAFPSYFLVGWPMADLAAGAWDVVVTNPDLQVATLPAGLEIVDCPPFAVTDFDLTHSFTCGPRPFRLGGTRLVRPFTLKLSKPGEADIIATDLRWDGNIENGSLPSSVLGVFDIGPAAAGGLWSLEYADGGGQQATLVDVLEVAPLCPRGAVGDLYACNVRRANILQFDGLTGDFVCIFAETPPGMAKASDFQPFDLLWAPNGNLWVTSVSGLNDAVSEFDGETGAFLGYIVPPTPNGPPGAALSVGGPDGHLYLLEREAVWGDQLYEFDRTTGQNLGVVVSPSPPMEAPGYARFLSNGNYLILGQNTGFSPRPTVREYDPSTTPFTFVRNIVVEPAPAGRYGALETPDGCCYLLTENSGDTVDKYDIAAGNLLVFIPRSPCLAFGPPPLDTGIPADPCYWDAMDGPVDLAYGPNGNLYVSSERTRSQVDAVWREAGLGELSSGAIHQFDPQTGQQVGVIGKHGTSPYPYLGEDRTKIYQGAGIEFKPMPGDFGSSGSAFQGDWAVDENDLVRFAAALDGTAPAWTTAANLLSFDQDRSGAVDCDDWPAFKAAFDASSGFTPELPLPSTTEFVNALLGSSSRPCFADRNGDGAADGADIALFVQALLSP